MRFHFIRLMLLMSSVFLYTCEQKTTATQVIKETSDANAVVKFSPYMPNKAQRWMSQEEAQNTPRFHHMIEVSRFFEQAPTEQQKQAAQTLYQATLANAIEQGWFSFAKAQQDGFKRDAFNDANHFINYMFLLDNKELDPTAPENLMFYEVDGQQILVGVMFLQKDYHAHGAQIGGAETVWHYHYFDRAQCLPTNAPETITQGAEKCDGGYLLKRSPEMLHVWFIEHPEGRFATSMSIDNQLIVSNELVREQTERAKLTFQ